MLNEDIRISSIPTIFIKYWRAIAFPTLGRIDDTVCLWNYWRKSARGRRAEEENVVSKKYEKDKTSSINVILLVVVVIPFV